MGIGSNFAQFRYRAYNSGTRSMSRKQMHTSQHGSQHSNAVKKRGGGLKTRLPEQEKPTKKRSLCDSSVARRSLQSTATNCTRANIRSGPTSWSGTAENCTSP